MGKNPYRKILALLGVFLGLWVGLRYLLPLFLPFLLGGALAALAEPAVKTLSRKLPRGLSSFFGVTGAFAAVVFIFLMLGALTFRELENLTGILPQMTKIVQEGLAEAENRLIALAARAPDGAGAILQDGVSELFSSGSALLGTVAEKILTAATGLLGKLPGGAVGFGTGILASYLISMKLPRIRSWFRKKISGSRLEKYFPVIREIRKTLGAWLKAQGKLAAVTFLIVCAGFFLLRIPYAPAAAAGVAIVDAVPMLGTGTVLIPWALVRLLSGDRVQALGLLGIYATAALTRSVLEPKMLGRHLGLDPLTTLIALYLGFRLQGILGMILSPMAAVIGMRLAELWGDSGRKIQE